MSNEVNKNKDNSMSFDMTFIPKNAVNVEEYKVFSARIFKSVPKKHMLLSRNIFNDEDVKVFATGLRVMAPWRTSKLVYIGDTQIDYPVTSYMASDGVEITIDYTLNLRIVDPIKYEFDNKDPLKALNQLTEDIMRVFVKTHKSDDLLGRGFSLRDIDPNNRYQAFADKYGLLCFDILFKCDVSQSLKDDYEKQKVQERENARALMEAENRKRIAQLEADVIEIKAKAEANANAIKLTKTIDALVSQGTIDERVAELLKTKFLSDSNAQVIANLGSGAMDQLLASLVASVGQLNNGNRNQGNNGNVKKK